MSEPSIPLGYWDAHRLVVAAEKVQQYATEMIGEDSKASHLAQLVHELGAIARVLAKNERHRHSGGMTHEEIQDFERAKRESDDQDWLRPSSN